MARHNALRDMIASHLRKAGLSQGELSLALKISGASFRKKLSQRGFTRDELNRIALELRCAPDELRNKAEEALLFISADKNSSRIRRANIIQLIRTVAASDTDCCSLEDLEHLMLWLAQAGINTGNKKAVAVLLKAWQSQR